MPTLTLDPRKVKPFAGQPRTRFRGIPKLTASIRAVGQVTPIVVTRIAQPNGDGCTHELIDGERRLRACLSINRPVKAVIDEEETKSRFALSVAANFCRQQHDCIEISDAILTLRDEGRGPEEIASIFGKSACWVYQHASLANLAPEVREMLKQATDEQRQSNKSLRQKGRMTLSLALRLVPLPIAQQVKAAKTIAAKKMGLSEARNYIQRAMAEPHGSQSPSGKSSRHASPRQRWQSLESAVDTFRHIIERYVTLDHASLVNVLEAAGPAQGGIMADRLEKLCEDLLGLADAISKEQNR